jgi:hypothetical protein
MVLETALKEALTEHPGHEQNDPPFGLRHGTASSATAPP